MIGKGSYLTTCPAWQISMATGRGERLIGVLSEIKGGSAYFRPASLSAHGGDYEALPDGHWVNLDFIDSATPWHQAIPGME